MKCSILSFLCTLLLSLTRNPHFLSLSLPLLLLDAIFGSDSGQMYRSTVPFRANDPLLQVPSPILSPSALPHPATPCTLSYPPLLCSACQNTFCILSSPTLHFTALLQLLLDLTLLHVTPLHITASRCMLHYDTLFYAILCNDASPCLTLLKHILAHIHTATPLHSTYLF